MAGTGGTSSLSSLCAFVFWAELFFGAGNREPEGCCAARGGAGPVEVRAVLALALELTERPGLYDFWFASGVARADVGVADNFRGGTTGESVAALASTHTGGGGGMLATFMLCD